MNVMDDKLFYNEIKDFARNYLDKQNINEKHLWERLGEFGILGLSIDEKYGGLGESYRTCAEILEILGYMCWNNGLIFSINNHIWMAQNLINLYGSTWLKNKYVGSMVAGETIGAFALTEPDAGSDPYSMKTSAIRVGDYYVINGRKTFVSNGPIADVFIVFAITSQTEMKKITAFVVDKTMPGITIGKNIEKMGLECSPTSDICFENCEVPVDNILGKVDLGNNILDVALEWERCFEFIPHIGSMKRIMEYCIKYSNERKQFGKQINENQSISHKIANMSMKIELAKNLMYRIVDLKDQGKSSYYESSIFKVFVSESYVETCRDAIQILGAYGYTKEYPVEKELRDAIASTIYSGTNEIQRNNIFSIESIRNMV